MAVFSKKFLSGVSDGRALLVTGVSPSTANVVHTAITGTSGDELDEAIMYAYNNNSADMLLTVRWGTTATAQPEQEFQQTIPFRDGLHMVVPGIPLRGGNTIEVYATTAMVASGGLGVVGYVNRVT